MFWSLVLTSAGFVVFVHLIWEIWKWSFNLSHVPTMRNLPWVGSGFFMPNTGQAMRNFITSMGEKYHRHFTIWNGPTPLVISGDAKFTSPILKSPELIKKSTLFVLTEQVFGASVLTMENGEEWKRRRHIVTPGFHFDILKEYARVFEKHAFEMNRRLSGMTGKPFDVQEFFTKIIFPIMCETAMGIQVDTDSMELKEYFESVEEQKQILKYRFTHPWLHPRFIFERTAMGHSSKRNQDIQNRFITSVIERKMKQHSVETPCCSYLDFLIGVYQQNKINMEDIKGEITAFLLGGHDTTTAANSWALYFIGLYPAVQDKLYKSLQANPHTSDKDILKRYGNEYLDMVIKESMRMRTPIPSVTRKNNIDCSVKAGTEVGICIDMVHHNLKYWSDPEVFDPERFNNNNTNKYPGLFTHLPFLAGPRNCLGYKFAMCQIRVILTGLLTEFKITAVEKNVETGWKNLQTSENGIWITLEKN